MSPADTAGRLTVADLLDAKRRPACEPAMPDKRAPYRIVDVPDEWGQDVRIVDVDGEPVLTVDTEHRTLTEAEEITRLVCAALNGQTSTARAFYRLGEESRAWERMYRDLRAVGRNTFAERALQRIEGLAEFMREICGQPAEPSPESLAEPIGDRR